MEYFRNFNRVDYVFGDDFEKVGGSDATFELFQNLTAYVDIIDEIKQNNAFYQTYTIQEPDRPDVVSQLIYGTPAYHWTFYILNDGIRKYGWPLSYPQLDAKIKRDFPHKYVETRDDLTSIFIPGQRAVGSNSGTSGVVLRRNLDLGTLIIDAQGSYVTGETIGNTSYTGITQLAVVAETDYEYNAPHHYEDAAGNWVDIDPAVGNPGQYVEVTNYDHYYKQNEELKTIKVIRPSVIDRIVSAYFQASRQTT